LIKELSLAIARDLRFIVYLYRRIAEISMKPINDAMIDYIQSFIQDIKKNEEVNDETKQKLEREFNDILERF
jgi:hypothetical protein